jgi:hypothetical protein
VATLQDVVLYLLSATMAAGHQELGRPGPVPATFRSHPCDWGNGEHRGTRDDRGRCDEAEAEGSRVVTEELSGH